MKLKTQKLKILFLIFLLQFIFNSGFTQQLQGNLWTLDLDNRAIEDEVGTILETEKIIKYN